MDTTRNKQHNMQQIGSLHKHLRFSFCTSQKNGFSGIDVAGPVKPNFAGHSAIEPKGTWFGLLCGRESTGHRGPRHLWPHRNKSLLKFCAADTKCFPSTCQISSGETLGSLTSIIGSAGAVTWNRTRQSLRTFDLQLQSELSRTFLDIRWTHEHEPNFLLRGHVEITPETGHVGRLVISNIQKQLDFHQNFVKFEIVLLRLFWNKKETFGQFMMSLLLSPGEIRRVQQRLLVCEAEPRPRRLFNLAKFVYCLRAVCLW